MACNCYPWDGMHTTTCDAVESYDEHLENKKRMSKVAEHQKLPEKNDKPCIQDLVIADIEARKQVGIKRYGTVLQPFNGRSALLDAYQEALDLCQYLRQLLYEEEHTAKPEIKYCESCGPMLEEVYPHGGTYWCEGCFESIKAEEAYKKAYDEYLEGDVERKYNV